MARQIGSSCNFILGYNNCELSEDTIDVLVKIRTLWGIHTLKEDWEHCTLKLRPLAGKAKPIEVLNVRLS